jgi:hypothetical protein
MALAGNLFNLGNGNGTPPPGLPIRAENYPAEGTPEGMSPLFMPQRVPSWNGNNNRNYGNNFQALPRRNQNDPIKLNTDPENVVINAADPEVIAENAQEGGRRRRYRKKTRKTRKTKKSRKSRRRSNRR